MGAEAFPDPAKVLAEMFRVLRPGGRVVLQTYRAWGEMWVWAEDDVRRMVNDAGFTGVTIRYAPAWGNDPVSKLLASLAGPLGGDLRLVRAIRQ